MMDILTFVNELGKLYSEQSEEFKALIKPPKIVQARHFERYVINLYTYLDGIHYRTDAEKTLYKLVSDFVADYDGAYL